jgi:hypothetical protein
LDVGDCRATKPELGILFTGRLVLVAEARRDEGDLRRRDHLYYWERLMTREQQRVFDDAVKLGVVKNDTEAYEIGCAALRVQIQTTKAKWEEAQRAEAQAIAALQGNLF